MSQAGLSVLEGWKGVGWSCENLYLNFCLYILQVPWKAFLLLSTPGLAANVINDTCFNVHKSYGLENTDPRYHYMWLLGNMVKSATGSWHYGLGNIYAGVFARPGVLEDFVYVAPRIQTTPNTTVLKWYSVLLLCRLFITVSATSPQPRVNLGDVLANISKIKFVSTE